MFNIPWLIGLSTVVIVAIVIIACWPFPDED